MALVNMLKLTMIGLSDEREGIIKALSHTKSVEIINAAQDYSTNSVITDKDSVVNKLNRINSALTIFNDTKKQADRYAYILKSVKKKDELKERLNNILPTPNALIEGSTDYKLLTSQEKEIVLSSNIKPKQLAPFSSLDKIESYTPYKKPMLAPITRISFNELESIVEKEDALNTIMDTFNNINSKILSLRAEEIRLNALCEQLLPYLSLPVPFNLINNTSSSIVLCGLINNQKIDEFNEKINSISYIASEIYSGKKESVVIIICHMDYQSELNSLLSSVDFTRCNFKYDSTAADKISELKVKQLEIGRQTIDLTYELLSYESNIEDLKRLYGYYDLELKKLIAQDKCQATSKTFLLEAWIPFNKKHIIEKTLENTASIIAMEISEPSENDIVPTLTNNNSIVAPYEAVTNMYSAPNAREVDPNPFVAIFFFIFFGIMLSDAGYGLILAALSLIILRATKPRRGESKMVFVLLMGGISTIFWGIMFGGWFGITYKPLLFNPLDEPLPMLGLALGMGVVQIMFGMGIQAYSWIKAGKWVDAVLEVFTWYLVFIGIGVYAVGNMVLKISFVGNIGVAMLAIGVLGLLIAGGRGKRGVKIVLGGFGKIYGIVNFISDILSYSRLFGLGLATGVVGMVINQLAGVIIDMLPYYLGYLFAIPVLAVGHMFNLAINVLGAYVHNCRLQYIEFFSKFYMGAGHQFTPLGSMVKYTNIE